MKRSKIISNIHNILIIYFLFGWILESQRKYLVFLLPSMQYQFLVNNNECFMTQLENKYLKEEGSKEKISFVSDKLKKMNIDLSDRIREYIIYSSVYISFVISYTLMIHSV